MLLSQGEERSNAPWPVVNMRPTLFISLNQLPSIVHLTAQSVIALSVYVLKWPQVSMVTLYPSTETLSFCLPGPNKSSGALRGHPHIQEAHQRQNEKNSHRNSTIRYLMRWRFIERLIIFHKTYHVQLCLVELFSVHLGFVFNLFIITMRWCAQFQTVRVFLAV